MDLQQLRAAYTAAETELASILAIDDTLVTPEQLARGEALTAQMSELQGKITAANDAAARARALRAQSTSLSGWATASQGAPPTGGNPGGAVLNLPPGQGGLPRMPAQYARARVSNFKSRDGVSGTETAYRFGQWLLATALYNQSGGAGMRARQYCRDHGIELQVLDRSNTVHNFAQSEGVNASGGFLVPLEFDNAIIDLREYYGVFRQHAKNVPMASDSKVIPRRSGGLTAYFIGENTSITESTKNWDQVSLGAKKMGVLARYSSELSEDAMINVADDLAGEIAYAFALKEDQCGFLGDGTSTYGGMVGLASAFANVGATVASRAGTVLATGTGSWGGIVLSDFNTVKSKLPLYASMQPDVAWYTSKAFFYSTMERLALAAGGVTAAEIINGTSTTNVRFLGYPVVFCQAMPIAWAVSQYACYFGWLAGCAAFGDRRQTTIAMSDQESFAADELTMRGTERFDINCHDVGNYSGTLSLQVPGPLVGLITATS